MGSLSKQDRNRALDVLAVWCILQSRGLEPDQDNLEKLGFGSVEAIRTQLGIWGVPDWVTQESSAENGRKARSGTGQSQELPSPAGAIPFFKQALQMLNEQAELLRARPLLFPIALLPFLGVRSLFGESGKLRRGWVKRVAGS
jgi:hypothetical protein